PEPVGPAQADPLSDSRHRGKAEAFLALVGLVLDFDFDHFAGTLGTSGLTLAANPCRIANPDARTGRASLPDASSLSGSVGIRRLARHAALVVGLRAGDRGQ